MFFIKGIENKVYRIGIRKKLQQHGKNGPPLENERFSNLLQRKHM